MITNSLFMCQDEDENEDEHQSFGSFWNLCMTNEPILQCIIVLRDGLVCQRVYPERRKTLRISQNHQKLLSKTLFLYGNQCDIVLNLKVASQAGG